MLHHHNYKKDHHMSKLLTDLLDVFSEFATDETAEVEGTWVPYKKSEFLVARLGNKQYADKLSSLYEKNRKKIEAGGEEADRLNTDLMIEVLATTILKGWKNVAYRGAQMNYSVENATKLLRHAEFRKVITEIASDVENYRAKLEEEQEKN